MVAVKSNSTLSKRALLGVAKSAGAKLSYRSNDGRFALFHGDSRKVLDAMKEGLVQPNLIYADPPYHLSNGGVSCQNGKMVSVNKGAWDASEGPEKDHDFVMSWLESCLESLEKDGAIWVSGTQHIIFSVGFGLQKLGAKLLNTVVWEKTAPPPNLGCRCFTHSHEFVLWARKTEKSKHTFHYAFEKEANGGKQKKDFWRPGSQDEEGHSLPAHWRIGAPRKVEKAMGKHPTQKPIELLDRIIRCSTNPGDLVVDPFCGSGTTGIAALPLERTFIGIDLDADYLELAKSRYLALREGLLF